jgi:hypothetical protein
LIRIRNINLGFLVPIVVLMFFMNSKSCYFHGLEILVGIDFMTFLSTSIIWYPDLFLSIYTKTDSPADQIPSWKDTSRSGKNTLAVIALVVLALGIGTFYMGVSNLITRSCT